MAAIGSTYGAISPPFSDAQTLTLAKSIPRLRETWIRTSVPVRIPSLVATTFLILELRAPEDEDRTNVGSVTRNRSD